MFISNGWIYQSVNSSVGNIIFSNMLIVVKYIDFLWCSKIISDDCQNFWKRHNFVTVKFLCGILQTTATSETAIETLNLIVWDNRFELSMCCEIFLSG